MSPIKDAFTHYILITLSYTESHRYTYRRTTVYIREVPKISNDTFDINVINLKSLCINVVIIVKLKKK